MSLGWKYYWQHHRDDYIFVSPWAQSAPRGIDIKGFQTPLELEAKVDARISMREHCKVIGSIPKDCRADFGKVIRPRHQNEGIVGRNLKHTLPVRNVFVKASGEDVLVIEKRLTQFVPFIAQSAAFYQRQNPELYRFTKASLTAKFWAISKGVVVPAGRVHLDPPNPEKRAQIQLQDSFLTVNCVRTLFKGRRLRPYDIAAYGSGAVHQQNEFEYDDTIDGTRMVAHLAFVREHTL